MKKEKMLPEDSANTTKAVENAIRYFMYFLILDEH
jgi:hypothetical protein